MPRILSFFFEKSTLPIGAGLGSSASISVSLALAMAYLGGLTYGTINTNNFKFLDDFPAIPMILTYTRIPKVYKKILLLAVRVLVTNEKFPGEVMKPILMPWVNKSPTRLRDHDKVKAM
nr:BPK_HP1_G0043530.mRNA.1.CDS.1 [Saccharomyces cerevisiae]